MPNQKDTWDLTHMFADANQWRGALEEAKTLTKTISAMQGTITKDADTLYQALQYNDQLGEKLTALFVYARIYFDENMYNSPLLSIRDIRLFSRCILDSDTYKFDNDFYNLQATEY